MVPSEKLPENGKAGKHDMTDFTSCLKKNKAYAGANGSKICIMYHDEQYMLKFPPVPTKNKELSYSNSCISEYISCHIFDSVGIPVQETLLGTYSIKGKEKICVACKDFTSVGVVLQDFASIKNQIIDSVRNGYGTELSDILTTIEEQAVVDPVKLSERFWDVFIVDALIGNWDRHNGNWGFLYDTRTDAVTLAPVFDCGSSLYPQADEEIMRTVLSDKAARDYRIFTLPTSALTRNGKRINYFNFISSLESEECNSALERMAPHIRMDEISEIIDATPYISDLQKRFYKEMLSARMDLILNHSLEMLSEMRHRQNGIAERQQEMKFL